MALISSINGLTREIFLSITTTNTSINPIDIYKEMRTLRRTDSTLRKWDLFMESAGNVSKGGGKFTERYVTLLDGTVIVPYDADGYLTVTGTVINDAGQEGVDVFDRSGLISDIDINYIPPQVEIIEVSSNSAVTAQDLLDIATTVRTELAPELANIVISNKILKNRTETNLVTGIMTVYDDDDTTVLFTAPIYEDTAAAIPYAGNAVNRRERLT